MSDHITDHTGGQQSLFGDDADAAVDRWAVQARFSNGRRGQRV